MIKIAAIDDDPNFLFLMELMVKKSGLKAEIQLFNDPEVALSTIEAFEPNYVFLDLFMPRISGWDFLRKMEALSIHPEVYFLSSSVDKNDKEKAKQFKQVKDFISKPLTFSHLKKIIIPLN
ncbi:response regulator [bacterium]|nr:MAG: response regulator [bacterium]